MVNDKTQDRKFSPLGVLIVLLVILAFFSVYATPTKKIQLMLDNDFQIAYEILTEIGLYEPLKDLVGMDAVVQWFKDWNTGIDREARMVLDGPVARLTLKLLQVQQSFVAKLSIFAVIAIFRLMVIIGALIVFTPAAVGFIWLAMRARKIRSSGLVENLTPYMQGVQIRLVLMALTAVIFGSLMPFLPIQFITILVILWLGGAAFVAARVQKL